MTIDEPLPYVAIGHDELTEPLRIGQMLPCPHCGKRHRVQGGRLRDGTVTDTLLFQRCGKDSYLVGVNGKRWRPRP